MLITSLTPAPEGRALLVRLYNTGDAAAKVSLQWHGIKPKQLSLSDLSGRSISPASDEVELVPYEVRTLRVELN